MHNEGLPLVASGVWIAPLAEHRRPSVGLAVQILILHTGREWELYSVLALRYIISPLFVCSASTKMHLYLFDLLTARGFDCFRVNKKQSFFYLNFIQNIVGINTKYGYPLYRIWWKNSIQACRGRQQVCRFILLACRVKKQQKTSVFLNHTPMIIENSVDIAALYQRFITTRSAELSGEAVPLGVLETKGNTGLRLSVGDRLIFSSSAVPYYKAFGKADVKGICLPCVLISQDGQMRGVDFPISIAFREPYRDAESYWESRTSALSARLESGEAPFLRPSNFADFVATARGKVFRVVIKDEQALPVFDYKGGRWEVVDTKPRTCYGFAVSTATSANGSSVI